MRGLVAVCMVGAVSGSNWHACLESKAKALPYCDTSLSHEQRVDDLLSRLNLEEQIKAISAQKDLGDVCGTFTAGKAEIGLPGYYWLTETNTAVTAACYTPDKCPSTYIGPLGLGASFNRTVWRLKGDVLSTEQRAFNNLNWRRAPRPWANGTQPVGLNGFGPNINVLRDPRWGRGSEVPGEDPFLSGTLAVEMVKGMQTPDSKGYYRTTAYLKHITAYSRETDRGKDTYNITMHDLHETYLSQYRIAFLEGGATGAMCSYDAENGHPSCANDYLLNQVIRKDWNLPNAHITSDCGAVANLRFPPVKALSPVHAAAYALNNGTDLEMGSTVWAHNLSAAVKAGLTSPEKVRQAAKRAFLANMRTGMFDPLESSEWTSIGAEAINSSAHQAILYDAALQGLALLRNENATLPLQRGTRVAVLGPMGQEQEGLLSNYAGDQSCWDMTYNCLQTIADAITQANTPGSTTQAKGVDALSPDKSGIPAALALAKEADVVVLVLGTNRTLEHEGIDRPITTLFGLQEDFGKQVLAIGKPTVLVLANGGPIAIDGLLNNSPAPSAIIEAFNPAGFTRALAATLFGDENRWGKLPYTMYPASFASENPMTNYHMALPPGRTYKYYTGKPLFPFGHGLSYTSFSLECEERERSVSCDVANTGGRSGDEVLMLYHSAGDGIRKAAKHPCPIRALVNYTRVHVPTKSSTSVTFPITDRELVLVDENGKDRLYEGVHTFTVSRGIGKEFSFHVTI